MGADGTLIILDKSKLTEEEIKLILRKCVHVYEREIFGHEVITIYWDTENRDQYTSYVNEKCDEIIKKSQVADWEVWT